MAYRTYTVWWVWPPPEDKPVSEYNYQETAGFAACPINVGVGPNYRTVSDEDWIEGMLEIMAAMGPFAFWMGFTDLLRAASREIYRPGQPYPDVSDYPRSDSKLLLPMPNAAVMPGDYGYDQQKWTPAMQCGMKHNPVFVGVAPFPALLAQDAWCENITTDEAIPLLQRLVNVLFCLRRTYGCPGLPRVRAPLGYTYDAENGMYLPARERV